MVNGLTGCTISEVFMTQPLYYVNGSFVKKSNAVVGVHDLGFIRGWGVFDFLVTYKGGKPFLLTKHLARLRKSAKLIGLSLPSSSKKIAEIILATIKKNLNGHEKTVRIVVTGGQSNDSLTPSGKPTLIVMVNDRHLYPVSFYKKGVSAITFEYSRENPQAKSLNYTFGIKAILHAQKAHALEAIYVNKKSNDVLEGVTSNVFIVKKGQVTTPHEDTLPGITRELVIKLCKNIATFGEHKVTIQDLLSADEVFLTATNKEVMPVVRIDKKLVAKGLPGPVTQSIMAAYKKFTAEARW